MLYRSYAKVNLTLELLGKRADGFHDLASLVHTISLADDLRIEPADDLLTRVEGLVIDTEANLVFRAGKLLGSTAGVQMGAELTLLKRIPAAAGLGGGSSDAATTLVGLNRLWDTGLAMSELSALGAQLGSDIPFFIRGGAALMQGRGEDIRALPVLPAQWLVLVVPPHDIVDKTRRLYAALDANADFSSGEATRHAADCLQQRMPLGARDLVNGFSRAALVVFPGLSDAWLEAERACERQFFLSGAGPALFGLAADGPDAHRQARRIHSLGLPAYAVRTVKQARTILRFAADSPIGYA